MQMLSTPRTARSPARQRRLFLDRRASTGRAHRPGDCRVRHPGRGRRGRHGNRGGDPRPTWRCASASSPGPRRSFGPATCQNPQRQDHAAAAPRHRRGAGSSATATSSSWLNQVERWLGLLTDQQLRRGGAQVGSSIRERHPSLGQEREREPPTLRMDQERRRDPRTTRVIYPPDSWRRTLEAPQALWTAQTELLGPRTQSSGCPRTWETTSSGTCWPASSALALAGKSNTPIMSCIG
jgi:hypothetical protein